MAGNNPLIGVLALQGDVREHCEVLHSLGVETREVRTLTALEGVDALVIPGGESSVMDKLARLFDLADPIRERIRNGMPAFGTCAGLIMLADRLADGIDGQETFGGLNVTVQRNAFGAQVDSFETELDAPKVSAETIPATFIRAPIVTEVGDGVDVLARVEGGRIVAVQQGNVLGISFHPEMNGDTRFHSYFLDLVRLHALGKKDKI